MSTITTRSGKGSPLTHNEVDANFTNLNTDKLQSGDTAASLTVTSADINGGTIDGTVIGGSTPAAATFSSLVANSLTYPTTDGTSGQAIITDGSGALSFGDVSGGGGITYVTKTANYTTSAGEGVIADTSGGAFTITLPASPSTGDQVIIADGGNWATTNLTVGRNGSTIEGVAADLTCDVEGISVTMVYDGSTWQLYPQTGTSPSLGIDDNATSTAITIDSSQNVGIGNSSPSDAYVTAPNLVLGNTSDTFSGMTLFTSASGSQRILFADGTTGTDNRVGQLAYDHSDNSMAFSTNASEAMRINSSGNVGIGTTSPNEKLVSTGAIRATGEASAISNADGALLDYAFGFARLTAGSAASSVGITFNTSVSGTPTERMRIDSSGNVGIGTANNSYTATGRGNLTIAGSGGAILGFQIGGSAKGYVFHDSTNIQVWNEVAGLVLFGTNATERMRIDSSGNVGIGTSSITTFGGYKTLHFKNGSGNAISLAESDGGVIAQTICDDAVGVTIGSRSNHLLRITTNDTERMRIDASGDVYFGKTSGGESTNGTVLLSNGRFGFTTGTYGWFSKTGSDGELIRFAKGTTTAVGSISVTTSSTSYNTSSDYRLKENVVTLDNATDRLKQIPVHRFNFIADPDTTVDGFIAHEVQDVVPEAITGAKDGMTTEEYEVSPAVLDEEGNVVTEAVMGTREVPEYQGIDQSKLVPLLTAALQEAVAKIEDLESRLSALEAN